MLGLVAAAVSALSAMQNALPIHVYGLPPAYELVDARVETTPNGQVAHLVYRELGVTLDIVEGVPTAVTPPRIPEPATTASINGGEATYGTEYVNFRHYAAIVWRLGDVIVKVTSQDDANTPMLVNAVLALR